MSNSKIMAANFNASDLAINDTLLGQMPITTLAVTGGCHSLIYTTNGLYERSIFWTVNWRK